jgi:hypothetical protein
MATKKTPSKRLDPTPKLPSSLTLSQWAKDDIRRARLAELLMDPVMQEAFETLSSVYNPSIPPLIAADGVNAVLKAEDLNNLLAMRHVHRSGFWGFRNALENLTREKTLRRAESVPWGNFMPEE